MTSANPHAAAGGHEDEPDPEEEDLGWDDDRPVDPGHPALDTSVAQQARIYDYLLGGKDNFEVDRKAADAVSATFPEVVHTARANRAFLGRVVRHLAADAGIRQFLDIGTGIPSAGSTHQVAQEAAPDARIVYVDNDPVVLSYAEALLKSGPDGATSYIDADVRDTATILDKAARTLDFTQPIAVTMLLLLHVIADTDDPWAIVATIMDTVPPGSYLAISHAASDIEAEKMAEAVGRINQRMHQQGILRNHAEVMRFFNGLEMVEPGLVQVSQWRPETTTDRVTTVWGGLGRKPATRR